MYKANAGRRLRRTLVIVGAIILVIAATAAVLLLLKNRGGHAVGVYSVDNICLDYEYANETQTDGCVTTDKLQSVYVSSTQQVTEIFVTEGQSISEGDPVLAFDTTLSELELERQSIKVDQLELDLQNAQDELEEIGTYRIGSPSNGGGTSNSRTLDYPDELPWYRNGTGTQNDPMVYLWSEYASLDNAYLLSLAEKSAELREALPDEPDEPIVPDDPGPGDTGEVEPDDEPGEELIEEPIEESESGVAEEITENVPEEEPAEEPEPEEDPEPETEPEPEPEDPRVFVVFEVRDSDAVNGDILQAWEIAILADGDGTCTFQLVTPAYTPETYEDSSDSGYIDTTVYYTAAEVAKLKTECRQKIADLTLQLKQAELEYDRLSYELSGGIVYSRIDGVVKTVRDVDESRQENKPAVLISGGGGYCVTAALGEFELGTMQVGDTVTVQSWESYETMEGTITEISRFPDNTGSYWYYSEGNQNISLYPFTIFVDEDASLREGEYVSVTYSAGGEESPGIYIEQPFIRQENGKSYVYAMDDNGLLEKRYVTTGKSLWGSYTEILSGVTADDWLAFPYGRDTKGGAPAVCKEIDDLYSYSGG